MQRDDFTFSCPLRVRWAEVDPQGVVFNPHYFAYFDVAVTEYWRALGIPYPEGFAKEGTDTFAVTAHAEFHASAKYDDVLDVCCRVNRLGRSSIHFVFGIYRDGLKLTTGALVYVNVSVDERRSTPWPDALREAIVRFERTRPELATASSGES